MSSILFPKRNEPDLCGQILTQICQKVLHCSNSVNTKISTEELYNRFIYPILWNLKHVKIRFKIALNSCREMFREPSRSFQNVYSQFYLFFLCVHYLLYQTINSIIQRYNFLASGDNVHFLPQQAYIFSSQQALYSCSCSKCLYNLEIVASVCSGIGSYF